MRSRALGDCADHGTHAEAGRGAVARARGLHPQNGTGIPAEDEAFVLRWSGRVVGEKLLQGVAVDLAIRKGRVKAVPAPLKGGRQREFCYRLGGCFG